MRAALKCPHYLSAQSQCHVEVPDVPSLFVILSKTSYHLYFNSLHFQMRQEIKNSWGRCRGKKGFDDDLSATRTTVLSRSALAYHHDSSIDGGLNRINIGISTTSTTSRSTSKTGSSGAYRADGYLRSTSTSTSGNIPSGPEYAQNAGIPPYGYDSSMFHDKPPYPDGKTNRSC